MHINMFTFRIVGDCGFYWEVWGLEEDLLSNFTDIVRVLANVHVLK
jgi:hypothetical protein